MTHLQLITLQLRQPRWDLTLCLLKLALAASVFVGLVAVIESGIRVLVLG